MVEFSWLHLTDWHVGMTGTDHLWPDVERKFYEDLEFLVEKKVGPLDMVIFTGDFVQQGSRDEFERVDALLEELWREFRRIMGVEPPLLAVPGNHDLVRPVNTIEKPNPALDTLMYLWHTKERVRRSFWENDESPQRRVVDDAFANYVEWYQNVSVPRPTTYSRGMLPGDFSTTIEKDNVKLGIVGLNSTYLQLKGGDLRGALELNWRQFNAACEGHGPKWAEGHRACLLLTHQPPDWLSEKARGYLKKIHSPPHQFALHLFGHMHESNFTSVAEGGANARNYMQGTSLFGLESYGDGQEMERRHGYSVGKLTIDQDAGDDSTGTFRIWPRGQKDEQDGGWSIDRDSTYPLEKGEEYTSPTTVKLLPQRNRLPRRGNRREADDGNDVREFRKLESRTDPVLLARLDALQHKLNRIPDWLHQDLKDMEAEQYSKKKLQEEVGQAVRSELEALDEVYENLEEPIEDEETAITEAWRDYSRINAESQEIFRECLELMGGLALRHKNLDDSICWLADEILLECANDYVGTLLPSFAVLARQEAVNRTMARIVRLRFPEWTVWSLPFTAHEFGHVVTEEDAMTLGPFLSSQTAEWPVFHLYEIVADTFATFMMGPAYICAAVLLRLDPLSTTDQWHLADTRRAHVMFTVLEWMNERANSANRATDPYKDIITLLRQQWQAVLDRARSPDSPLEEVRDADKQRLRRLVIGTLRKLRIVFRPNGPYPATGNNGFQVACGWARDWSEQLAQPGARKRLALPNTSVESTLRDALNAAWLCRTQSDPDKVDLIDDATYKLCMRIIEHREPSTDRGAGTREGHPKQLARRATIYR